MCKGSLRYSTTEAGLSQDGFPREKAVFLISGRGVKNVRELVLLLLICLSCTSPCTAVYSFLFFRLCTQNHVPDLQATFNITLQPSSRGQLGSRLCRALWFGADASEFTLLSSPTGLFCPQPHHVWGLEGRQTPAGGVGRSAPPQLLSYKSVSPKDTFSPMRRWQQLSNRLKYRSFKLPPLP